LRFSRRIQRSTCFSALAIGAIEPAMSVTIDW
jgi:hypothetical protein